MQSNNNNPSVSVMISHHDDVSDGNLVSNDVQPKKWVNFDEEEMKARNLNSNSDSRTVLEQGSVATIEPSQSVQITNQSDIITNGTNRTSSVATSRLSPPPVTPRTVPFTNNNISNAESANKNNELTLKANNSLQNIPLNNISHLDIAVSSDNHIQNHSTTSTQTYSNGDIIVTLLPLNSNCDWVTPAKFKPELVPEELMSQCLSLTVEDYVNAMEVLVNDLRFNLYITLYKRILVIWVALGITILLSLLFSGAKGMTLFVGGIIWLIMNSSGIFASMWIKIKLYHMLESCMAKVNSMFYKFNILVGIDDRGNLSCHKVNLIFVYFDVNPCIKFLQDLIDNEEQNSDQTRSNVQPIDHSRFDINTSDIIITGTNRKNLSQKEKFADKLLLRYSQRWVKEFVRRRIDLNLPIHGDASVTPSTAATPRHCNGSRCPCQFIEEHLRFKPTTKFSFKELFM